MIVQYLAALALLVVIDGIWLGVVARGFYKEQLGPLMRDPILWPPAILFYLVYAGGLTILAIGAADRTGAWTTALALGAVVGLVAYGTYDLTNLATMKGFPVTVAVVDILWGTIVSATVAAAAWVIAARFTG
jgi:uncharacterized membrane protein